MVHIFLNHDRIVKTIIANVNNNDIYGYIAIEILGGLKIKSPVKNIIKPIKNRI